MAYLRINGNDYSAYCNKLDVRRVSQYRAQTNAAGNTVVDNQVPKREVTVGIIPLSDGIMANLLDDIYQFEVTLDFRNPQTNALETGVVCIVPESEVSYYTIQGGNRVLYNALEMTFTEL